MRERYQRSRASWKPHLEHSRRFVVSVAERCRNRSKAVILGAGLLLDVPLEELSSLFREVVLIDIVFLPEARRSVRKFDNVKLIRHDVTNMAQKLYENIHHGHSELPESIPTVPEIDDNTGLVVSLNILSQLWVVPRMYALWKLPGLDEELVEDWCRQIVESHYAYLRSKPCSVCFIADHEAVKYDREGRIASRESTVFDMELPRVDASWTWDIVPMGYGRQFLSKELNVGAWHLR
jgi:uncharacterized UPF0146 family protein